MVTIKKQAIFIYFFFLLIMSCNSPGRKNPDLKPWTALQYKEFMGINPLKGFVPYRGIHKNPHSMEWFYISLKELMTSDTGFHFTTKLDPILNDIASRGNQACFRVYLDYPGEPTGIPQYLLNNGLNTNKYSEYGGGKSPDYNNKNLVKALELFIAKFGEKYDGDPRIAFITAGLLGFWGEWHTYPHENWFPGESIQNRILHAYNQSFKKTKVLLRYPTADSPYLPFGYHDDSFAWETLPTKEWHFWKRIENSNLDKIWKTQPIGGELRPQVQVKIFNDPPEGPEDFYQCLKLTHCSWLLNDKFFTNKTFTGKKLERAIRASRSLGYDYYIKAYKFESNKISIQVENRGTAPFYYKWDSMITLINKNNEVIIEEMTSWDLSLIVAGENKTFEHQINLKKIPSGEYKILFRLKNPLAGGKKFNFSNKTMNQDITGYLSLTPFIY